MRPSASQVTAPRNLAGTAGTVSAGANRLFSLGAIPFGGGVQMIEIGLVAKGCGDSTANCSRCSPSRRNGSGPRMVTTTGRPASM